MHAVSPLQRPLIAWVILTPVAIALTALVGCETRVVHDGWAGLRQFEDRSQKLDPLVVNEELLAPTSDEGWAIFLARFDGKDRQRQANRLVDQLQREAFINDVWLREADGVMTVYRGRFALPGDLDARSGLRQTRMVELDGKRPFASADLVPLGAGVGAAATSSLDLRQHVGCYSLQVAVYDDQIGPDFRGKAEEAARVLRADGDEAYFYHGPNRSMVTIGLFTDDDFVPNDKIMAYGPRVLEVQKKYPYNLVNGLTLIEKQNGQNMGEQPSFLVRVN